MQRWWLVLVAVAAVLAISDRRFGVLRRLYAVARRFLGHKLSRLIREAERQQYIATAPRRIVLIRHGESKGNRDHSVYSHIPDHYIELTDAGHKQAEEAGTKLRELLGSESVTFLVSPYTRCRQTCEGIRKAFGGNKCRVREDPRLREQEFGMMHPQNNYDAFEEQREKVGRFFFRFPNGESGADVFDRVTGVLESMFRRISNSESDNIVIVSHGLLMRLFLMRFFWLSVEQWECIENFRNCEMCILRFDEQRGKYELESPLRIWKPVPPHSLNDSHDVALSTASSLLQLQPQPPPLSAT